MRKKSTYFQKMQRKRRAGRDLRNPYFRPSRKGGVKWMVLSVFFVSLVGAGISYFFHAQRFALVNVEIQGLETIPREALDGNVRAYFAEPVAFFFRRSNRFLFQDEVARARLEKDFSFESLSFEKKGGALLISLKEKTSRLLWETGEDIYLVDLNGIAIRKLTEEERAQLNGANNTLKPGEEGPELPNPLLALPVFIDIHDAPLSAGVSVLSLEEVNNIFLLQKHLGSLGILYEETNVDRIAGKWMSIATDQGYDILFDPTGDIDQQATNLVTVLRTSVTDPKKLQYIDLRFGDHVYFK